MNTKTAAYSSVKAEILKDSDTLAAYQELEPAYQIARLRIQRGLTQAELAERVGTQQPSIARLESGDSNPTLEFLQRVVTALGARLVIHIEG